MLEKTTLTELVDATISLDNSETCPTQTELF
jgi:hypothetical protein